MYTWVYISYLWCLFYTAAYIIFIYVDECGFIPAWAKVRLFMQQEGVDARTADTLVSYIWNFITR